MKESLSVGEIVQSLAGRDKGKFFSVIKIYGEYVCIADGRTRKVSNPKRKKIKHLKKVSSISAELVELIMSGKPIGNERLYRAVKTATEKIQED